MICGAIEFTRDNLAKELYAESKLKHLNDSDLYPIQKAIGKTGIIFDASKITNDIGIQTAYKDSIVLISQDRIRQELVDNYPDKYSMDLEMAIINARIKTAFKSGASVIYEAINLEKHIREWYMNIAMEYNISETELHVIWLEPEESASDALVNILQNMNIRLR